MATFKEIKSEDIVSTKSFLNQLVDIIQEDISGSTTRKTYQVFVTGGLGPGVTSSLFQTIWDQDFSLQSSNPLFDMTIGCFSGSDTVASCSTGVDSAGKVLFPSRTLMMREKVANYRQFGQLLAGNADYQFRAPYTSTAAPDKINNALFLCFKRLFSRDMIKKETFAMKFFQTGVIDFQDVTVPGGVNYGPKFSNLNRTSTSGSHIYVDVGASSYNITTPGGEVGNIVDAGNTGRNIGLLYYDYGMAILDLSKVMSGSQHVSGVIDAVSDTAPGGTGQPAGKMVIGHANTSNPRAKFIPDLLQSGSIDNVINHIASCRLSSGSDTAITFQNITNICSTLIFCRATADEFNYSQNPTFRDADGRIVVIDPGQQNLQRSFTFVTGIVLLNANNDVLAKAKLSRPIQKNYEKDLTFRVRLDF